MDLSTHHHHPPQWRNIEDLQKPQQKSPAEATRSNSIVLFLSKHLFPLLFLYLLIGFFGGSFLFAWTPTQALYIRRGAYAWLCAPGRNEAALSHFVLNGQEAIPLCNEQLQAIDRLMPVGVASIFVFALFGGLFVDLLGPKIACSIGLILQISGWSLVAFCRREFPFYLMATMLIGAGSDPLHLALLDYANGLPSNRGLIIGFLCGCRSLSFGIPIILNHLLASYSAVISAQQMDLAFCGVLLLCLMLVVLVTPSNSVANEDKLKRSTASKLISAALPSWRTGKTLQDFTPDNLRQQFGSAREPSFFSSATTCSVSSQFRPSRALSCQQLPHVGSFVGGSDLQMSSWSINFGKNRPSNHNASQSSFDERAWPPRQMISLETKLEKQPQFEDPSFESVLSSGLYLPLFPIAATTILSGTFFAVSAREQLKHALPFFTTLCPLSFICSLLIGMLSEHCGPVFVLCIMNCFSILQFVSLLFENLYFSAYITLFASIFLLSFLTPFYVYVALTFRHSAATLYGIVIACSGLVCLVVTPMCDFAIVRSRNFTPMNILCLCLTITNFCWIWILHHNRRRFLASCTQATTSNEATTR